MSRLETYFLHSEGESSSPQVSQSLSLYQGLHTGPLLLLLSCSVVGLRVEQTVEKLLVLWA